jgi:hypothetical protein
MDREERLVAELQRLGIRYISRKESFQARSVRPPRRLLADLVGQPSSRVRMAIIPLLLAKPQFSDAVPAVIKDISDDEAFLMKILYTAAMYLQQIYAEQQARYLDPGDRFLADRYSAELGLPEGLDARAALHALGQLHKTATALNINWAGTYENAVQKWLRQMALEEKWKQFQPTT